jgi:hypothetical protein
MLLALVSAFSGPSPLGLATIFYCLEFEISLFVASYDSQGHGGGIVFVGKSTVRSEAFTAAKLMKSSRFISRVNWLNITNISGTISLRVWHQIVMMGNF